MQSIYALNEIAEYVSITEGVLNYLASAEISKVLRRVRLEIFKGLQKQEVVIYGFQFELHPQLKNYFSGVNEYSERFSNFDRDPKPIVEFKKVLNLLYAIENVLKDVEKTDAIFHYETAAQFSNIEKQIHQAVRELLDLDLDYLYPAFDKMNFLSFFCRESIEIIIELISIFTKDSEQHIKKNLEQVLESLKDRFLDLCQPKLIGDVVGFSAGVGLDLLSPHHSARFMGELISVICFSMDKMSIRLKNITDEMAVQQAQIPSSRWKELDNQLERIFQGITKLNNNSIEFSLGLTSILHNMRQVFNFYNELSSNIGRMSPDTQESLKIKLKYFKYNVLVKLKVSLDVLESELMCAPGSLSDKIFPYIENNYQRMIGLVSHLVQFENIDEDIFWLTEKTWFSACQDEYFRILARHRNERLLLELKISKSLDFLRIGNIGAAFPYIAPYLMKMDSKLYNHLYQNMGSDFDPLHPTLPNHVKNMDEMNELFGSSSRKSEIFLKIENALNQELNFYKLQESLTESRIEYLRYQSEHYAFVLKHTSSQEPLKFEDVCHQFNGYYALVYAIQRIPQNSTDVTEKRDWYWVDKYSKTIRKCNENDIPDTVKSRLMHLDTPQKLTIREMKELRLKGFGECLYLIEGIYAKVYPKNMNPDISEEQWFIAREASIKFFNLLKYVNDSQKVSTLHVSQKMILQENFEKFGFLLGDDSNDICTQLRLALEDDSKNQRLLVETLKNKRTQWLSNIDKVLQKYLSHLQSDHIVLLNARQACIAFFNIFLTMKDAFHISSLSRHEQIRFRHALNQFQYLLDDEFKETFHALNVCTEETTLLKVGNIKAKKELFLRCISQKIQQQQDKINKVLDNLLIIEGLDLCSQLQLVERADYFWKHKQRSEWLAGWQTWMTENWFSLYTPTIQRFFAERQDHLYQNLHQPDLILLEPQQVVEQKLVFNILGQLKAFCENLESYQISNFDQGYFKLHIDIIIGFLNFNNLLFFYFKTEHHFDLIQQILNVVKTRWQYCSEKLEYYHGGKDKTNIKQDLNDVKNEQVKNLRDWIHRLFSLPPIIRNLNEPIPLTRVQVEDLRLQNDEVSHKVYEVLLHTNSFMWILWNIPSIKQLIVGINEKFQEARCALYDKTMDNLMDLKMVLFKDLLLECDEIELDLGIKSELFSDQVNILVDALFENLLQPLDLEMSQFSALTLKADAFVERLHGLAELQKKVLSQLSSYQSELAHIEQFDKQSSEHHFKQILPLLVKYNECRTYPVRKESLSVDAIREDQKFRFWIKKICEEDYNLSQEFGKMRVDFSSVQYNDIKKLIHYVKNALKGWIASEQLKLICCQEKSNDLAQKYMDFLDVKQQKLKTLIRDKVNYYYQRVIDKVKISHPELCEEYQNKLLAYLKESGRDMEQNLLTMIEANMEKIDATQNLQEGLEKQFCIETIHQKAQIFINKNHQNYCQLNDILTCIDVLRDHLIEQQKLFEQTQFLWFENQQSLLLKIQSMDGLKAYLLDANVPIDTRIHRAQAQIQSTDFQKKFLSFAYSKHWDMTLCVQYFWCLMNYFGWYQTDTQLLFNELLEDVDEGYRLPIPELKKHGLFVEKDTSYQNDLIEAIRQYRIF